MMKNLTISLFVSFLVVSLSFAGNFIPSSGIPVENQYIVVLKEEGETPSAKAREALLKNLATQHGAQLARTYDAVLNGGVMQMTEARAKALAHNPFVDYVEQDSVVQLVVPADASQQTPTPSWGLDRIDQRYLPLNSAYSYANDGAGVTVYVIDTGIYLDHNDFGGRASSGIDIVNDGNGGDCHGHGTHVAGTIGGAAYGVAKQVSLLSVRVLNCNGSGSMSGVIAGVDWVTANIDAPAVANMSLGGGKSRSLDTAVSNSIKRGVAYVVAAGNSGRDACNYSPSGVSSAITVGATSSTDSRPSWSNYGSCLDLFAPGVSITSSWIGVPTSVATISGTSMAAPHVAGAAALMLGDSPYYSPGDISSKLIEKSTKSVVKNAGSKSPNRLLFTDF